MKAVLLRSAKDRVFCAGAMIRRLAQVFNCPVVVLERKRYPVGPDGEEAAA